MRKLFCLLLALILLSLPAAALSAASWALYDPLTGQLLRACGADVRRGMASTTKLMTALVAAERYDPARTVTVRPAWCGIEGSSMYLRAGETLTVRALLCGLLLCSGNDAAAALAGLDGDPAAFVAQMNARAAALRMADTHFDNPSGLDGATHYSTAHDLCLLAQAVLDVPLLREIVATRTIRLAGRWMQNHNRLLADDGVIGLKTGYTRSCGRCLVSAMKRQGRTLIAVTLNAPDDWNDHRALYREAFADMVPAALFAAGPCGRIPVAGSGTVGLYLAAGCTLALTPAERARVRIRLCGPRLCYAGLRAGTRWGTARAELDGAVICEQDIFYADSVPQPAPGFWERLLRSCGIR